MIAESSGSKLIKSGRYVWFHFQMEVNPGGVPSALLWVDVYKAHNRMATVDVNGLGVFAIQGVCSRAKD